MQDRERRVAEASWASTADGRLAYDLAKAGMLHDMVTCSGAGYWPAMAGASRGETETGVTMAVVRGLTVTMRGARSMFTNGPDRRRGRVRKGRP